MPFLSLQTLNKGIFMKLSKTEQKVIDSLKYHKSLGYKQATFDTIQHGKRFMDALHKLLKPGLIILINSESSMYDQHKGIGKTSYWQQVWTNAYTVRLSDNNLGVK